MPSIVVLLSLFAGALCVWLVTRLRQPRSLPPGPKPWPIIGNLFNVPTKDPWITYRNWTTKYDAELLYLHLPKQPTIILNSRHAARDLLQTKDYSDRPVVLMDKLTGWEWNLGLMPYGNRWRAIRSVVHQHFHRAAVKNYSGVCAREVHAFLQRARAFTHGIDVDSISHTFGAIILEITYGIKLDDTNSDLVLLSRKAVEALLQNRLGVFWVEFFPFLRYLPSWLPGSSATRHADLYRPIVEAARTKGFEATLRAIADGTAPKSMTQQLVQKLREEHPDPETYAERETTFKDATGIVYTAAVDTQTSATMSFILAMGMYPSAQEKARTELDRVVGRGRLPSSMDISSLPYIQAIALEVFRWFPINPLGVPRCAIADDVYQGYFIPKGTTIVANIWSMLHNPNDYPDPDVFKPERFLRDGMINPEVPSSIDITFGFGRRGCPGKHLAVDTLTLLFASVLHVFAIEPTVPHITMPSATLGLASFPEHVPCRLVPRSAAALTMIESQSTILPPKGKW